MLSSTIAAPIASSFGENAGISGSTLKHVPQLRHLIIFTYIIRPFRHIAFRAKNTPLAAFFWQQTRLHSTYTNFIYIAFKIRAHEPFNRPCRSLCADTN